MNEAPFRVGERVRPDQLVTWTYTGLSGRPGLDKHAVRRYRKGEWILEIRANPKSGTVSVVTSIRTADQDDQFWKDTRHRLMRNKGVVTD